MARQTIRMMGMAAALSAAALVSACSQESAPTATKVLPKFKAPLTSKGGPTADELTAGMVQAASQSKAPLPMDVKFEIAAKPAVGKPIEINFALIAQASGGPATLALVGTDGFDAVDGGKFVVPEVQAGQVYRHSVHLTPTADGVLLLGLNVAFKHDEATDSKDFSLPVIVGR
jgi:hypothetical protein